MNKCGLCQKEIDNEEIFCKECMTKTATPAQKRRFLIFAIVLGIGFWLLLSHMLEPSADTMQEIQKLNRSIDDYKKKLN